MDRFPLHASSALLLPSYFCFLLTSPPQIKQKTYISLKHVLYFIRPRFSWGAWSLTIVSNPYAPKLVDQVILPPRFHINWPLMVCQMLSHLFEPYLDRAWALFLFTDCQERLAQILYGGVCCFLQLQVAFSYFTFPCILSYIAAATEFVHLIHLLDTMFSSHWRHKFQLKEWFQAKSIVSNLFRKAVRTSTQMICYGGGSIDVSYPEGTAQSVQNLKK